MNIFDKDITSLSDSQIEDNKQEVISLLSSINREGKLKLIDYLTKSDFFYAPASTKYHGAFNGGLCAHSLLVYKTLKSLSNEFQLGLDEESMIVVALLHDISKIGLYEKTFINKKIYSPTGSKWDENGHFDWKSIPSYKIVDDDKKFMYGNHEENSEFILRQFIPLKQEESMAIIHHHGGLGWDSTPPETIPQIYKASKLSLYLHIADLICAYSKC